MPFQSEKQRRYLWANEPEIARDWTDTYGSGIAKALGGRIGFWNGSGNIRQQPHQPRDLLVQNNPYGTRPRYQPPGGGETSLGSGAATSGGGGGGGPPGGGDRAMTYTAPVNRHTGPTTKEALATGQRKKDLRDLIARQQAEKDYTPKGVIKPGPQRGLGFAGSGGLNLGSMASGFAGSKIGGGLGSMLFGPWGALLGALFGRRVGKRAYDAYQTKDTKETAKDILLGQNTLLSNLFSKKKTPTTTGGEGIQTIDIRDKFNRLAQPDDRFATAKKRMTEPYWDKGGTARFPYDEGIDYRSDLEKMAEASGVRDRIEPESTDYPFYREGMNRAQYTTTPELWNRWI